MHSMVLWPVLSFAVAVFALVPTIQDSGYRSLTYWLIIPPLLAGVFAAWSHFGSS